MEYGSFWSEEMDYVPTGSSAAWCWTGQQRLLRCTHCNQVVAEGVPNPKGGAEACRVRSICWRHHLHPEQYVKGEGEEEEEEKKQKQSKLRLKSTGWWHCVYNVGVPVNTAVTHNFASSQNFPHIVADLLSDEDDEFLRIFRSKLKKKRPQLYERFLQIEQEHQAKRRPTTNTTTITAANATTQF